MRRLVAAEYRCLELALIILVLLNGVSIASRYVFRHALGELFEIMILGGIAAYWVAIATAEREKAHLGVDSFVMLLPRRIKGGVRLVRTAVVAAFYGVVVWSGILLVLRQISGGTTAGLIDVPLWTIAIFIPLSASVALWRCLVTQPRSVPDTGRDGGAI